MMMNLLLLPAEINTEILSRLPTESLVECKRVCKTWRSLIDEPAFVDAHTRNHVLRLDHSSCDAAAVTSMFFLLIKILEPRRPHGYVLTYEFHCGDYINNINAAADDDDDNQMGRFKITKPPNNISNIDSMSWMMVGSCNGLICLSGCTGIYVYNPCTNEYVNLGHPRFKSTSPVDYVLYNLNGKGFGYHPSTNEYKVVFIFYYNNNNNLNEQQVGEVSLYTLGSSTWRTIEDEEILSHTHLPLPRPPNYLPLSTPSVHMNGALHWIRLTMDGNYPEIVSFDLAEEKFISNTIMLPYSVPVVAPNSIDMTDDFQLGLLGGCLSVTQHTKENSSDVWVMNNRSKSWTMKFRITQKDDWRYVNRNMENTHCKIIYTGIGSYDPIALLGNGRKILLRGRTTMGIILCDVETGDIDDDIRSDGYQYLSHESFYVNYYAAIPYVRSIVSLKALGEEGAKKKKHNDSLIHID